MNISIIGSGNAGCAHAFKFKSIILKKGSKIKVLKYLIKKLFLLKLFLLKDPKIYANKSFRGAFNRDINWDNPINLIEKIFWLQIYSDITLWTRCADKYLVREYVKERGCENILNELYGKYDNADEIDWESLPDSFVLKTNHACGQVILIKNKKDVNKREICEKLTEWMNLKYGIPIQLHYLRIKPCIIAEMLFINKDNPEKSLIDYKIWCFHGVPECILVVHNRTQNGYFLTVYDLEWNNISKLALKEKTTHGDNISKPKSFDKMIEYAKILSEGIPQVRVDFYDINEEPVLGEMTFSTGFGYFTDSFYDYLGSKIDLSKIKKLEHPNKLIF